MNYLFNENGICENPKVVYHFMPNGAYAWAYSEIEVCENNGAWDFGCKTIGYCSACTNRGTYSTEEEAISAAVERMKNALSQTNMLPSKDIELHNTNLKNWLLSRRQLSLF